jgi:hypothetical protein
MKNLLNKTAKVPWIVNKCSQRHKIFIFIIRDLTPLLTSNNSSKQIFGDGANRNILVHVREIFSGVTTTL